MKTDRNGRAHRLVPVTDPAEQAAVLRIERAELRDPIGVEHGGQVYAERNTLEQYRNPKASQP